MPAVIIIIIMIVAFFIGSEDYEKYTKLDKACFITNIILSILYIPLSLMGIFTIFVSDGLSANISVLEEFLINTICYMGLSIPIVSIVSIKLSISARKKGKSKFSFAIQFFPIFVFIIMIGLMIIL